MLHLWTQVQVQGFASFQEGLLAPGISPEGRRACLLIGLAWAVRGQTLVLCLKGEGDS